MNARASLIAIITASVPELAKRICSTEATRSTISLASRTSSSAGSEKAVPRSSWSTIAA